jgi:hypothetical protein
MRLPPPEVVAQWPKINLVNPETRGAGLMVIELTLLPIAMIVVFLRMWVRIVWLRKSWYDDYLMILAMVCFTSELPRGNTNTSRFSQLGRLFWLSWPRSCMDG